MPSQPETASHAAIELHGLSKRFGSQTVLNGIDLTVAPGETLAVLGRSGTGKSVLLKLLIGLQTPDAGSIQIHGQEMTGLSGRDLSALRTKVGFLFQDAALYDSMTVADNVAFPLRHGRAGARRDRAGANGDRTAPVDPDRRVTELLSFVGMDDAARKQPSEISGGMKKRVGLARALALDPDILLFDEPTSALDPITARDVEGLIRKLQEERHVASIVVTHDLSGARHIARRVAFLHEGAIVFDGTFDDLERCTHPVVSRFVREAS